MNYSFCSWNLIPILIKMSRNPYHISKHPPRAYIWARANLMKLPTSLFFENDKLEACLVSQNFLFDNPMSRNKLMLIYMPKS